MEFHILIDKAESLNSSFLIVEKMLARKVIGLDRKLKEMSAEVSREMVSNN
jgi:hypothetical protein